MRPEHVTHRFIASLVDELARCGVRHVSACPGSRSTSLAMLLDQHPDITLWMHLDERSAAFFALGIARALRQPTAVLCTSGTAAANFLPAVVEARHSRVPLVVLTADRPPELQDVGANQTIDQSGLYGRQVKWSVDVSLPDASPSALRYVRSLAARALGTAREDPAGPVHLNIPLREPLVPLPSDPGWNQGDRAAWGAGPDHLPTVRVQNAHRLPAPSLVDDLAGFLSGNRRGIIVCGPQDDPRLAPAVTDLSLSLGYPVLADPLSQVRCGPHDRTLILDAYDAFLRDQELSTCLLPEVVVRCGGAPTSKALLLFLGQLTECRQIVVDAGPNWNDPTLSASDLLRVDPPSLFEALAASLASRHDRTAPQSLPSPNGSMIQSALAPRRMDYASLHQRPNGTDSDSWTALWLHANRVAREVIARQLSGLNEPFEGKVCAELSQLLPDHAVLFAGNSMPVRDLDTFFPGTSRQIRCLANRGASGIDGVVSSALGASAVSPDRLVLVIGDLSFYHDLNGLLAAKQHGLDATIILLNNDGGGIFSFLPQAERKDQFERLFGTPHGLDFRPAVEMYGGTFERVRTWEDFRAATSGSFSRPGLSVIELPTERERNRELHREIMAGVTEALRSELMQGAPV